MPPSLAFSLPSRHCEALRLTTAARGFSSQVLVGSFSVLFAEEALPLQSIHHTRSVTAQFAHSHSVSLKESQLHNQIITHFGHAKEEL